MSGHAFTIARAVSASKTWAINGLYDRRPLAAKILATAAVDDRGGLRDHGLINVCWIHHLRAHHHQPKAK